MKNVCLFCLTAVLALPPCSAYSRLVVDGVPVEVIESGYNSEKIPLPVWYVGKTREIHSKLRERLCPSDYNEVLKGEYSLLLSDGESFFKSESEYIRKLGDRPHAKKLPDALEQILANPDDRLYFARAMFLSSQNDGVHIRENVLTAGSSPFGADKRFIITRQQADAENYSARLRFWDARTGKLCADFLAPSLVLDVARTPAQGMYYFTGYEGGTSSVSIGASNWAGTAASYLVDPSGSRFQSFPCKYGEHPGQVRQYGGGTLLDESCLHSSSVQGSSMGTPLSVSYAQKVLDGLDIGNVPEDIYDGEHYYPQPISPWQARQSKHCLHLLSASGTCISLDLENLRYSDKVSPSASHAVEIRKSVGTLCATWWCGPNAPESVAPIAEEVATECECNGFILFSSIAGGAAHGHSLTAVLDNQGRVYVIPPFSNLTARGGQLPLLKSLPTRRIIDRELEINDVVLANENEYLAHRYVPQDVEMLPRKEGAGYSITVCGKPTAGVSECAVLYWNPDDADYTVRLHRKCRSTALPPVWLEDRQVFLNPLDDYRYAMEELDAGGNVHKLGELYVTCEGYAVVLPNGHYAGSPGCESFLMFGEHGQEISMQALAPWRNRPAEILERIGGDAKTVSVLKSTTERWLRKQGFNPDDMPGEPQIDDFPVAKVELPELFSKEGRLQFRVNLNATARDMARLDVRADGVLQETPQVHIAAGNEGTVFLDIPLATGQNWIEVTPVDAAGIAGEATRFRTVCDVRAESRLYAVCLGVSEYENVDMRLQYAAKDARDLAAAIKDSCMGTVNVLCLTDGEVQDRGALQRVEEFLASATVNDRVLLYIAGHGLLDADLQYYYAPAAVKLDNLAKTGISMDDLAACLNKSAARQRLLLMDTCHAGFLGEAGQDSLSAMGVELPAGIRAIQTRGMKLRQAGLGLNATQSKRYVEELFSFGKMWRGLNIIAGSAGAEFARESSEWNNGVFTSCLIDELRSHKNRRESVAELAATLSRKVAQLTGNAQKPDLLASENHAEMLVCGNSKQSAPHEFDDSEVREIVKKYLELGSSMDAEAMRDFYAPVMFKGENGAKQTFDEYYRENREYASRWARRNYTVRAIGCRGHQIEVQMEYCCTDMNGKVFRGYSRAGISLDEKRRVVATSDTSSRKSMPAMPAGFRRVPLEASAEQIDPMGALSLDAAKVKEIVQRHMALGDSLDRVAMMELYAANVSNPFDGTSQPFDDFYKGSVEYASKWRSRSYDITAIAFSGNTIEVQMRYSCTNMKGKKIQGYSKATLHVNGDGKIDAVGDDSSKTAMPPFSPGMAEIFPT